MTSRGVVFTKHASEKFELLKRYGFVVSREFVEGAVANPDRVDQRADLAFAIKALDEEYGLRVVYRRANDNIVVLTFYPVRRERFGV